MILLSQFSVIETYQSTTTCANTGGDTPSIVFNGCTFNGCAISMPGQVSNNENGMQDLFQGIKALISIFLMLSKNTQGVKKQGQVRSTSQLLFIATFD